MRKQRHLGHDAGQTNELDHETAHGGRGSDLFPMHLPLRPAHLNAGTSTPSSRRRAQRQRRWRNALDWMEWLVVTYSFMAAGSPKSHDELVRRLGPWKASPRQQVAAEMLVADLIPFCRLQPEQALSRGRGIAKMSKLTEILTRIETRTGSADEQDLAALEAVALPVQTEHVKNRMPQKCGRCDPNPVNHRILC